MKHKHRNRRQRKNHQEQALAFFPESIGFDFDLPEWLVGG